MKLPITVYVDNVGAIFMVENVTTSQRTKHVDIRYKYVREFVLSKFLKIEFVRTTENTADLFTKNVSGELYRKHASKLITKQNGESLSEK